MRYVLLFASVLMLAAGNAMGQEEETVQEERLQVNQSDEPSLTEDNDFRVYTGPEETHEGDTVILEDGRQLDNVQVLRRTATDYEIQVVEGMASMFLPRAVVSEIKWDDYDPLGLDIDNEELSETVTTPPPPNDEAASPEVMTRDQNGNVEILPGKKVPGQLAVKLQKNIAPLVPQLSGKGILDALKMIGQAVRIRIVADEPVRKMANENDGLKVDVNVTEDATVNVAQFFHNYLFKQPPMKNLDIVYMPDRMIVTTKEAAEKIRADLSATAEEENEESPSEEETDEGS
ncbi:MAG: hypothetical protein R6V12_14855 [Candidatus Hydrogenedentota bacterium]